MINANSSVQHCKYVALIYWKKYLQQFYRLARRMGEGFIPTALACVFQITDNDVQIKFTKLSYYTKLWVALLLGGEAPLMPT